MADTDTIERPPPEDTGGLDVSSALTVKPSELEPPKSVTPAPVPKSATVPLAPQIAEELLPEFRETRERGRRTSEAVEQSMLREQELRRRQIEEERPQREALSKDIDTAIKFREEHQPQPPAPLPPRPRLKYNLKELLGPNGTGTQLMQVASAFAGLSGGTVQDRMIIMLKAYVGMIDGWAKNKENAFKENYDAWRDEVQNIRETEQRQNRYVDDILNNSKESLNLKMKKLELFGTETKNAILAETAFRQDIDTLDRYRSENLRQGMEFFRLAETFDKNIQKQEIEHLMDQPGIRFAAESALAGDPTQVRSYRSGSAERIAAENLIGILAAERGISQQDLIAIRAATGGQIAGGIAAGRLKATGPIVADIASLRQQETMYDAIVGFEEFAKRNFANLLETAKKTDRTGSPLIDRYWRAGEAEILGNSDMMNLRIQLATWQNEFARITGSPRLVGALTDSMRHEVENLFSPGMSYKNMRDIAPLILSDFRNREETLRDRVNNIRARIDPNAEQLQSPARSDIDRYLPPPMTLPGAAVPIPPGFTPEPNKTYYINGKPYRAQGNQMVPQ